MDIEQIKEDLANHWAEQMDIGALIDYFIDHQLDYLNDLPEAEVINLALEDGIIDEEDLEEED